MSRMVLSWDDIAWLRDRWKGWLYIKGVPDPEDAVRCVAAGAGGIAVSNHGGRQLEYARGSVVALPGIAAAVGEKTEILLDGGIRHGTDVIKALALGAGAVLIGRPWVYGATVAGKAGVARILEIFRQEISVTLTLMGGASVRDLSPANLIPRAALPGFAGDRAITHEEIICPHAAGLR